MRFITQCKYNELTLRIVILGLTFTFIRAAFIPKTTKFVAILRIHQRNQSFMLVICDTKPE